MATILIQDILCPLCFQIPQGNIFDCPEGHYICHDCSTIVTNCPVCRSDRITNRFLLLERILDHSQIPCGWSEQGCQETMFRGQLLDHEDLCDFNPDTIKFCSMFPNRRNCGYKVTSNWLSEADNHIEFISHVNTCLGFGSIAKIKYGEMCSVTVGLKDILSGKPISGLSVDQIMKPTFYRLGLGNGVKQQIWVLIPLLKMDSSGNQIMSFAIVQLTPLEESTPVRVKFVIDGVRNAEMVSKWGQNRLSWTQKVISFKEFVEMVEKEKSMMYSIPVALLSEYYVNSDKKMSVNFTLEGHF